MNWDDFKSWQGDIEVNGTRYTSLDDAKKIDLASLDSDSTIVLYSRPTKAIHKMQDVPQYRITVKQYMTKPASDAFDFMKQWNNDVPMPLRTMVGTIEKQTRGMVYMKLHGDITSRQTQYCMKCGKTITNPVSQFFGMGPECGGHNYVNPFESEEELREVVDNYRINYLNKITWEGWIIKSAILEQEEVK